MYKKFILFLLPIFALLNVSDTFAINEAWSPPYASFSYIYNGSPNNTINSHGCNDGTTSCAGDTWVAWTNQATKLKLAVSPASIYYFGLKTSNNTFPNLTYDHNTYALVTIQFTSSNNYAFASDMNNYVLGASRYLGDYETDPLFLPIKIIDDKAMNVVDKNFTTQTITILYKNYRTVSGNVIPRFYQNLYLGEVPEQSVRFTNAIFYDNVNKLIEEQNVTLNQINDGISKINLDGVKVDNSDIVAEQKTTNDLLRMQKEQEKEQYDQEKEEERQREEEISDNGEELAGIFNFSVLNPFNGIFAMFSPACSVNIPIISSWINSPSSVYRSWWCNGQNSSIRSVLTPVFSIAAIMLVFGFFVRWLKGGGDTYLS